MEMLKQSPDYLRKKLYLTEFIRTKNTKNLLMFSYCSATQAETHYKRTRQALSWQAKLIAMPCAYQIVPIYPLQGPQVYLILYVILTFVMLTQLFLMGVTTCFFENSWYAFFLFLEIRDYECLKTLCGSAKTITHQKLLVLDPNTE